MVNQRPLVPGDSEMDDLFKIFRILGTPNEDTWLGVNALPVFKSASPKWPPKNLQDVIPGLNSAVINLLSGNAIDSHGKAEAKISKGKGSSNDNFFKELVTNESLIVNMDWSRHPKSMLIMDKVDGMSAGDRRGEQVLLLS